MYVPKDPEQPELGETRVTRGGFKNLEEAQAALADALKKKARSEKFQGKVPTVAAYAKERVLARISAHEAIQRPDLEDVVRGQRR